MIFRGQEPDLFWSSTASWVSVAPMNIPSLFLLPHPLFCGGASGDAQGLVLALHSEIAPIGAWQIAHVVQGSNLGQPCADQEIRHTPFLLDYRSGPLALLLASVFSFIRRKDDYAQLAKLLWD